MRSELPAKRLWKKKTHEYKGHQELYIRQKSIEFERLVEIAKIQSMEVGEAHVRAFHGIMNVKFCPMNKSDSSVEK